MTDKTKWSKEEISLTTHPTTLTEQLHGLSCPNCDSRQYSKNGKAKDNQRYICSECGKHFRSTTGNTIHHIHYKHKIRAYIDCMNQGLSLRKTAKEIGISLQTAFRWRHKFLSSMQKQSTPSPKTKTIISAYVLPFSNKGNKKPITKKHTNVTSLLQTDIAGNCSINIIGKYGNIHTQLLNTISQESAFLNSKALPRTLKSRSIQRTTLNDAKLSMKIQKHITDWLSKFRGVATKYLVNYWAWFSFYNQLQIKSNHQTKYLYKCL